MKNENEDNMYWLFFQMQSHRESIKKIIQFLQEDKTVKAYEESNSLKDMLEISQSIINRVGERVGCDFNRIKSIEELKEEKEI
jgi:hypothetical protein